MSSCHEIRALLDPYVDHELGPGDVNRVDNHLSVCDRCAEDLRLLEHEAGLLREALIGVEEPVHVGIGLWERMQRARMRWTNYAWYAAAAAASIVVALLIGVVSRPAPEPVQLGRVTLCSGPLEHRTAGEGWAPLASWTILQAGDRVRTSMGKSGTVILNADRRIDLRAGTELVFGDGGTYGRPAIQMERGHIHGDLPGLRAPLVIATPIAEARVAAPVGAATAGAGVAPAGAEFEIRLAGIRPELGFFDRIHLLPAACAAPRPAELEVLVYRGSVELENPYGRATIRPGQRIRVMEQAPMPKPETFAPALRTAWWLASDTKLARADRPTRTPTSRHGLTVKPPRPRPLDPTPDPERPRDETGDTGSGLVGPPIRPAPEDRPPAPERLTAVRDVRGIALSWKPAAWRGRTLTEYHVYRRGPGDARFRPLEPVSRCTFRDTDVRVGAQYAYKVAAAGPDGRGGLLVGDLSGAVAASSMDFRILFKGGGSDQVAQIVVQKAHKGMLLSKAFIVRKRNPATGETGMIGSKEKVEIEPIPGHKHGVLVDFSTKHRLVDIVREKVPDKHRLFRWRSKIVIEDKDRRRYEIERTDWESEK